MDLANAKAALLEYIEQDIPAFMWGAPGLGKSDIVREIARDLDAPLIDLRAALLDPVDLRGLPAISDGRAQWLPPAFLPDAQRDGEGGILFLDELNAAPPSVQTACFQLVLDRRVGEYRLPASWRIIAAGNRQSDKAAAQRMPSALANRFAHIDVEASPEAFCDWAARSNLNPIIPAFIRFRPALLHKMEGELRAFPTPRAWSKVAKVLDAPASIRFQLIAGLVGEPAAVEIEGFLRVWLSLPSIKTILSDPTGAPVPPATEPAAYFALASALARAATSSNFAAVIAYCERLPSEFAVMAMTDAAKRNPAVTETTAFIGWSSRNIEVLA